MDAPDSTGLSSKGPKRAGSRVWKLTLFVAGLGAGIGLMSSGPIATRLGAPNAAVGTPVLAEIAGKRVTLADLPAAVQDQVHALELERYLLLRTETEAFIDARLSERAAVRGESPAVALERRVEAEVIPPSPEQVAEAMRSPEVRASLERQLNASTDQVLTGEQAAQRARQIRVRVSQKVHARLLRECAEVARRAVLAELRVKHGAQVRIAAPQLERKALAAEPFVELASSASSEAPAVTVFLDPARPRALRVMQEVSAAVEGAGTPVRTQVTYLPNASDLAGNTYAQALLCAAAQGPARAQAFHGHLLGGPAVPEIGELVSVAERAGLQTLAFSDCVSKGTHEDVVSAARVKAQAQGIHAPAVFIDGVRVDPSKIHADLVRWLVADDRSQTSI